jgi:hypothetical protein
MAFDHLVKERSNDNCRALAKEARAWFGQGDAQYVDICECLTKGEVKTAYGVRRLVLEIKPAGELKGDDAVTTYVAGIITITVEQPCWDGAERGQVRPRQTLVHELGHAVQGHVEMRAGVPMARRHGAAGKYVAPSDRPSTYRSAEGLPASKSAEHQAKVFAPAFLINDRIAETLSSASEIALAFGISQQSAEIYYKQLNERRNRKQSAQRVRQMADDAIAVLSGRKPAAAKLIPVRYMTGACPICGAGKILPTNSGFQCQNCTKVFDHQDGDEAIFS